MSSGAPVTEFEFRGGALRGTYLTLYADRLVHRGSDALECVPLAQLASARVAFERDRRKLNWTIALLVAALVLVLVGPPLQEWSNAALAEVAERAGTEAAASGVPAVLRGAFRMLGRLGGFLPTLAALLAAAAALLGALFWLGATTLTLSFAATERAFAVFGRSRRLFNFAEDLVEQLTQRVRR